MLEATMIVVGLPMLGYGLGGLPAAALGWAAAVLLVLVAS
jgi:hypothetical protein